ncbi:MAG TPA: CoA pyrophosphatase [Pyrinomonadaceae bacterium]|jgi:8-oxo-dGTP pyrophosphatase MutT (NUDIX family)
MNEFESLCLQLSSRLCERSVAEANTALPQAAVALVLRRSFETPELLVIKRAVHERDHWSGHLALPGGRRDRADADLRQTAIRETLEEVGIDLASGGQVLGPLETIGPRSPQAPQIAVTPFVAVAPAQYNLSPARPEPLELSLNQEVAAAFWVPVNWLKKNGRSEIFRFIVNGKEREWPSYPTPEGPIWGLTERVITNFLSLIE